MKSLTELPKGSKRYFQSCLFNQGCFFEIEHRYINRNRMDLESGVYHFRCTRYFGSGIFDVPEFWVCDFRCHQALETKVSDVPGSRINKFFVLKFRCRWDDKTNFSMLQ